MRELMLALRTSTPARTRNRRARIQMTTEKTQPTLIIPQQPRASISPQPPLLAPHRLPRTRQPSLAPPHAQVHPAPCKPSVQPHSLASAMFCTPAMSTRRLASMGVGQSDAGDVCIYSPRMPRDAGPPPLRRTEWVALPEVTDEDGGPRSPASDVSRSPLCANLRLDLNAEDLALRAEKCAETIGRASLSLRSCSLLRDPEAIAELCENLRQAFRAVQRALDETPTEFIIDGSDTKQNWYTKHWETIDSLNKNLSLFFLLSRQIEDHPPRIHKLAPLLDKLATYHAKFTDLVRRINLSYEKLRLLNLRATLSAVTSIARRNESEARARRREECSLFQEGRMRRRELREEMRHVRGTIRTLRDRHMEAAAHDENMNMMICHDDGGNEREGARKAR
ncbi:hypothetical protein C8Q74DRAFT_937599 [Fomes fomentarius]|nr:hypothetical protein C8Q74DRAFT_937599 [Fomes fomentarius]